MAMEYTLPANLPVSGQTFNGRDFTQHEGLLDICCNISTPYHIIVMYNTSGLPDRTDVYFSVSPAGTDYCVYDHETVRISPPHRHDYFELMIVLRGSVLQVIEGKEYLYTPGSCCLINRNIIHTERFQGEGVVFFLGLTNDYVRDLLAGRVSTIFPQDRVRTDNTVFDFMEENLRHDDQKYYLDFSPVWQRNLDQAVQQDGGPRLPGHRTRMTLHGITDRLVKAVFLPRMGVDYRVKGLVYELFDYLNDADAFHILPVRLQTRSDTLLFYRIRQLMHDADGRLSRSQLEQILHYSGNYLNTIVKQNTSMSLTEYGMSISLEKAAGLLRETDLSVGEILDKLHFTNQGHFTRLFREKYGMSPGKYRKSQE